MIALKTLTNLLDYRSFMNAREVPNISNQVLEHANFYFEINAKALRNAPQTIIGVSFPRDAKTVSGPQAALFIRIGDEGRVIHAPTDLVVKGLGFEIELDNYHVRNAIVRDATITYHGGPLILENVYFVNCTFRTTITPTGRLFADAILGHVPATFTRS